MTSYQSPLSPWTTMTSSLTACLYVQFLITSSRTSATVGKISVVKTIFHWKHKNKKILQSSYRNSRVPLIHILWLSRKKYLDWFCVVCICRLTQMDHVLAICLSAIHLPACPAEHLSVCLPPIVSLSRSRLLCRLFSAGETSSKIARSSPCNRSQLNKQRLLGKGIDLYYLFSDSETISSHRNVKEPVGH